MESEVPEVPVVSRIAAGMPAEVLVLVESAREAVLALAGVALDGCSPGEVAGVLAGVEVVARALGWTQLCHAQAVHRGSLHQVDGHRRPGSMLAHCAQLRPAEGSGRDRMGSALVAFPGFARALREGRVGMGQVDRLAKAWRNPRVRDELVHLEAQLLAAAEGLSAADFDRVVAQLVLLLDADGAEQRQQSGRRARLVQDPDGGFILDGLFPGEAGVMMRAVFDAFVEAEFAHDVAAARAAKDARGDSSPVTKADLPRDAAKRRADAVIAIFWCAANASGDAPKVTVNLTMSLGQYLEQAAALADDDDPIRPHTHPPTSADPAGSGHPADPVADAEPTPAESSGHPGPTPAERTPAEPTSPQPSEREPVDVASAYRRGRDPGGPLAWCGSGDGHPLLPAAVGRWANVGHVRRQVIGADGVVLDVGRRARLYTGNLRDAVLAHATHCTWAGGSCPQPSSHCQADHLVPFSGPEQGTTSVDNGAPLCGYHNRTKHLGFTHTRAPDGSWHTHRPDGTEI